MAKHHSRRKQLLSQPRLRLQHINSSSCNSSRSMPWHRPKLLCLGKLAEHPAENSRRLTIPPPRPASKALPMAALPETRMASIPDDNSLDLVLVPAPVPELVLVLVLVLVLALVLVVFLRLVLGIALGKAPVLTWLLLSSAFAMKVIPGKSLEDLQRLGKALLGASTQDTNAEATD